VQCPFCDNPGVSRAAVWNDRPYHRCGECAFTFLEPTLRLDAPAEKARYLLHENDLADAGYRTFIAPLIHEIVTRMPPGSRGLDFGAGTAPVLYEVLRGRDYHMEKYDPFFWPDPTALDCAYDFVASVEVVEHFYQPQKEFRQFRRNVRPGGLLALMTHLHDRETDLTQWYYLRDPTHVSLYQRDTFRWLANAWDCPEPEFIGDRIVLMRL